MDFYRIELLYSLVMHPSNAEWDRIRATCNRVMMGVVSCLSNLIRYGYLVDYDQPSTLTLNIF